MRKMNSIDLKKKKKGVLINQKSQNHFFLLIIILFLKKNVTPFVKEKKRATSGITHNI
jgi:hypothetical protein